MTAPTRISPEQIASLRGQLGEVAIRADAETLARYAKDETEDLAFLPDVVALPDSTEAVARLLRFASRERIAVTPRGAGTGLSGGALAVHGGIVLSLERLDRIREIDERNLVATVEAGVVTGALQRQVEELGLFYPPDPASKESSTIGGNIAEDSAGPRSAKYGTTRRYVLGLEAVTAAGDVLALGGKNRKDVAGYNLAQLLVGSEGTLAVVTAATLRLLPHPKATLTLILPFDRLETAAAAVERIFQKGFDPAACELMEEAALAAVGAVETLPAPLIGRAAILLLELHGDDPERLLVEAEAIESLTELLGADEALVATGAAEERRLWQVRRKIGEAVKQRSVYKEADTVVPRSALADLVHAARRVATRHGLVAIVYGHAADGNLHVNLLRGDSPPEEWEKRRDAAEEELFKEVVALGGTITGEHGIGWVQKRFMPLVFSPAALDLMRAVKNAFDPQGILNPGKMLP